MQSTLQPGETILHTTRANYGRGFTARTGRLTLTDKRLVFEPRRMTSPQEVIEIPVEEIASAERIWLPGPFGLHVVRALQVDRRRPRGFSDRPIFMVNRPVRWREALSPHIRA